MEPKEVLKKDIAKAETTINAPAEKVWNALITPSIIKQYMFGATVVSDWKKGSKIIWKGEWKGKPYEDKGVILQFQPTAKLQYSHYSPLLGLADSPDNYHTVTIELSKKGDETFVSLTQDNNETEKALEDSENNWKMMLSNLKKVVEAGR